ncbi:heterokaryon incompatibility protein-domain-containing protein [Boeremia exigua]|uniref:heterokaryon incompatibility protein-domain-containing protein n=1 Tax=Boeremia exigua TaxID=749465 RepID=UPI001E8D5CB2|nr:heterokaryon incompatibility protein-domain-containing protein [Boeremia exigua]KAH6615016.1 heterokaryon incompatibility protein-domain-containing protein [Boeremia exigua]
MPLPIWVDALCINQADDAEKSWQVQMMDQIYLGATKTFVYLGPSTRESYEAIRSFSFYGRKALQYGILNLTSGPNPNEPFEFGYERWTLGPSDVHGKKIIDKIIRNMQDPNKISPLKMLQSIMHRPWWSRIWVLQELLLSPNPIFVCGYQTISAREFVASVRLYEATLTVYYENLLSMPTDSSAYDLNLPLIRKIGHETRSLHNMADVPALVLYTTQLRQRERSRCHGIEEPYFGLGNLWDLVQDITLSSRRLDASDPRDRIYALIGIARLSRVDTVTLQPEYALTCAYVYAQATYLFMQYTGPRMLMLAIHSHKRTSFLNLSSWIVDWSLTDLMTAPFPIVDSRRQDTFQFTRSACDKSILTSSVTVYGKIEVLKVKVSTPGSNEHQPDIIRRLLRYLSDLEIDSCATLEDLNHPYEQLISAMALNSHPDNFGSETSEIAPMKLHAMTILIREELFKTHSLEVQASQDTECATSTKTIDSWLRSCPTINPEPCSVEPSQQVGTLSLVLDRIRDTIEQDAKVFVVDGDLIGIGSSLIRDGDLLIEYEKDALRFVIRAVEGGFYKLIDKACVPRLDSERTTTSNCQASTISLC